MTDIKRELALIPQVLAFFGQDDPRSVASIKLGISNHNYVVTTRDHEFVVKFLINQRVETVENDLAIQRSLSRAGLTTPTYLSNDNGAHLFVHGTHCAVLSCKLNGGVPHRITAPLAYEFGQMLGGFHIAVTTLPHPTTRGVLHPSVSGIHSPLFAEPLPRGIIHGDFHAGNVLVDPAHAERIVALLDFEEAGENLYLVDLALTIMAVCADAANAMDRELIEAVLKGYGVHRPLGHHERLWFSAALTYAAQTWICWFQANGHQKYANRHQQRWESLRQLDLRTLLL